MRRFFHGKEKAPRHDGDANGRSAGQSCFNELKLDQSVASCAVGQGLCRWERDIPCGTSYFFILREGREREMKELKRNALVVFMTVGLSALTGFIGYFVADRSSILRAEKMELFCFTELKIGFDNCKTLADLARG